MARAISPAALSPWTATGFSTISIPGNRLRATCTISLIAAPVGEVTTPIRQGRNGSGRFLA